MMLLGGGDRFVLKTATVQNEILDQTSIVLSFGDFCSYMLNRQTRITSCIFLSSISTCNLYRFLLLVTLVTLVVGNQLQHVSNTEAVIIIDINIDI